MDLDRLNPGASRIQTLQLISSSPPSGPRPVYCSTPGAKAADPFFDKQARRIEAKLSRAVPEELVQVEAFGVG